MGKESPEDSDKEPDHQLNGMVKKLIDYDGYSEYVQNILLYISDYIVSKLVTQVKCSLCVSNLTGSSPIPTQPDSLQLQQTKSSSHRNRSIIPSIYQQWEFEDSFKVCDGQNQIYKYTEHIFKLYVINQPNHINTKKNLKTKMILELCQHFGDVATKLLPPQHEISINEPLLEEDHRLWLL